MAQEAEPPPSLVLQGPPASSATAPLITHLKALYLLSKGFVSPPTSLGTTPSTQLLTVTSHFRQRQLALKPGMC